MRFTRPALALLLAVAYALGTCVWATGSETLWQQTVNVALLTGAIHTFLRLLEAPESRRTALLAGLLLGAATASRPTAIFVAGAIAGYLFVHHRRTLPLLVAGAVPMLIAVAAYNLHYFGSPLNFAQELIGHQIAFEKTGSHDVWQTPLLVGAVGLLISPSRGLLVFSPFLALSFWGLVRLWKEPNPIYAPLRPLSIAALLTMGLQCKWFDWWGGWTYGYRPWLEAVPVLVLCMLPVIARVCAHRGAAMLLAVLLGWSVFVQGLGAFAYDKYWNARDLFAVVELDGKHHYFIRESEARSWAKRHEAKFEGAFACNIDLPQCRYRLWSLEDNVISFYLSRFSVVRQHRMRSGWHSLALFE
jgi:hypothetical protein